MGTLWENNSPGFHRVTKYVIIPDVHQPTAPFELVINKDAWAKLSDGDKQTIRDAAFKTTMESWLTIGQEDAKALAFFREQGNEVIELDPAFLITIKALVPPLVMIFAVLGSIMLGWAAPTEVAGLRGAWRISDDHSLRQVFA